MPYLASSDTYHSLPLPPHLPPFPPYSLTLHTTPNSPPLHPALALPSWFRRYPHGRAGDGGGDKGGGDGALGGPTHGRRSACWYRATYRPSAQQQCGLAAPQTWRTPSRTTSPPYSPGNSPPSHPPPLLSPAISSALPPALSCSFLLSPTLLSPPLPPNASTRQYTLLSFPSPIPTRAFSHTRLLPHAPSPTRAFSHTRLLPHAPSPTRTFSHTRLLPPIHSAACVDLTHLCIVPGKAAWAIWLVRAAFSHALSPLPTHCPCPTHALPYFLSLCRAGQGCMGHLAGTCCPLEPPPPPVLSPPPPLNAAHALNPTQCFSPPTLPSPPLSPSPISPFPSSMPQLIPPSNPHSFTPLAQQLPRPPFLSHPSNPFRPSGHMTLPAVDVVANGKVFLHSQQGAQADGGRTGSEGEGGGGGRGDGEGVSTEEGRRDRGGGEGEEAGVEGGKGAERDGDGLVVEQTVEGRRLELQALPLAQTVCLYGGHLLVDPTAEEERLGSGSNNVIIAMDMMAREEGSGAGKGAEEEGEKGGGGKGERKGVGKGGGVGDGGEELLLVFKAGGSTRLTAAGMQDCIAAAAVNLRERRTALLDALAEAEKGEEEEEEDDVEEGEEGEEMEN
ncbi:unnamed protein product [Closterium sp. Naga37s-1]|nr:unnamed protein product [Closterium sp. Naga37s-1]